jgi:cell division protein ZipA
MILDTEMLRVVLIIAGVVVILIIYIWERLRRDEPGEIGWQDSHLDTSNYSNTEEPTFSIENKHIITRNKSSNEVMTKSSLKSKYQCKCEDDEDDYWRTNMPQLMLQLNISAKGDPFSGAQILKTLETAGFKTNEHGMFHYYAEDRQSVLFSVASMIKPGIIPIQAIDDFKTPGLIIFSDLSDVEDGIALFADMLSKAKAMAMELNAELQDDTHSKLTNQAIEHINSQILEYQRQIQLASRRCNKV